MIPGPEAKFGKPDANTQQVTTTVVITMRWTGRGCPAPIYVTAGWSTLTGG